MNNIEVIFLKLFYLYTQPPQIKHKKQNHETHHILILGTGIETGTHNFYFIHSLV